MKRGEYLERDSFFYFDSKANSSIYLFNIEATTRYTITSSLIFHRSRVQRGKKKNKKFESFFCLRFFSLFFSFSRETVRVAYERKNSPVIERADE